MRSLAAVRDQRRREALNRRQFLRVAIVAGVAIAVPVKLTRALCSRLPLIMGDGIHDDAAGLNAAVNGKEFLAHEDCVVVTGKLIKFKTRTYRLNSPLYFGPETIGVTCDFNSATLFSDDKFVGDAKLDFRPQYQDYGIVHQTYSYTSDAGEKR